MAIDVERVRRGSRRRGARTALAGVAAVVLVTGTTAITAGMLRGEGTTDPVAPATSTDGARVLEDCPEPVPGVEIATSGIADVVFVLDREFQRVPDSGPGELGNVVAGVTCTIADQSPEHDRPAYAFWHEGNVGYLPLGTEFREVTGHDPRCRIAAVVDGETRVYATELELAGDCRPDAGTGCPDSRPLPENVAKLEQRSDFVKWAPYSYRSVDKPREEVPLGEQIGLVTCNIEALTDELQRDREVTGPFLSGNATYLPVGTKLYAVADDPDGCRIAAVVDGEIREYLASQAETEEPMPCAEPASSGGFAESVRVEVPSHCGVLSVTVAGQLWLADPPLGDHNPPPDWDENRTPGDFVQTGPARAEFLGDGGQAASFKLAPEGVQDPNTACE